MNRARAVASGLSVARCALLVALAGCASTSGLTGGTPSADAGDARRDGPADAPRDALPGSAAVAVASSGRMPLWCALTAAGDVECWGDNESGALGDGTMTSRSTPAKVAGIPGPVTQIAAGGVSVYALTTGGAVWAWGQGDLGELGNGTSTLVQSTPVPVSGLDSGVVAIASGDFNACAVKADGSLWCWGQASAGLLGTGDTTNDAHVPVAVPALSSGVTAVAVGDTTACAVQAGAVFCWGGTDGTGSLGNGTTSPSPTPVAVSMLAPAAAVATFGAVACALTTAGGVWCWGNGTYGQLGNGQVAPTPFPVAVTGLGSGVTSIAVGPDVTVALLGDGRVRTWGFGALGELGTGTSNFNGPIPYVSDVPVAVTGFPASVVAISAGAAPCAVDAKGEVSCWGLTCELANTPVPVTGLQGALSVTVGGYRAPMEFACALDSTGAVRCWGGNGAGQLGDGTTSNSSVPVANAWLNAGGSAVAAGSTGDFACGVISGIVQCWGDNSSGQLGNGTLTSSHVAVAVQGLPATATRVAVGGNSACAITGGGALFCWGDNTFGQLGTGTTASSSVAVAVPSLASGVVDVSVGVDYACAVLSNGAVDCWGRNSVGQLGNGSLSASLVPVPVKGLLGTASGVAAGWFSACAACDTGVQCWGANAYGMLGDGTSTDRTTAAVAYSVRATKVAVGTQVACAIVLGAALCWGTAYLGDGSFLDWQPRPVAVTGLGSGVTDIAVGEYVGCAVVHGSVQCWGLNTAGQLGNGGPTDGLVPTLVPGFP